MTKKNLLLIAFILLKFVMQYILVNPVYELQRDEFLHLDQANHLSMGYVSVPPVTSWISFIIQLFGNSIFWIRFFPALFGALTIVMVWKSIETLKGNLFSLILGANCVLFSSFLRLNILYQPNSLDALCWTMFCFVLIKYCYNENSKWFYVGMTVLAFGFLNKYNIVFLIAGFLPALLLTKRSILKNKHLYLSLVLFLLLILPNLIWQYINNFPVYHHMQQLANTQLKNVNRWDFIKEQVYFFMGSLFVILAGLYALLFYQPFKKYKFFFLTFCFTLIIFTCLKAKGYYAIGLYPIYIAFGAVYLENLLNSDWKNYLRPIAALCPILFFIPFYRIGFPNRTPEYIIQHSETYKKHGLLRWEDGKDHALPQDYADMLGWKELAIKIDDICLKLPNLDKTLILCDNYGQAGAINYYTKNKSITAVSFNADYLNWFKLDIRYRNLIRIKTLESRDNELNETSPFFENSKVAGTVTNKFSREFGTTIFVFTNSKIDVNQRIKEEITKEKNFR